MMIRRRNRPTMMSRTQRACWLFLAMMKTSSGFTPTPSSHTYSSSSVGQRRQVVLAPPLHLVTEEQEEGAPKNRKGPFRRAVHHILRKKRPDEDKGTMHMLTTTESTTEQQVLSDDFIPKLRLGDRVNADFILQNFQNTAPNDVFPSDTTKHRRNVLTSEEDLSVAEETALRISSATAPSPRTTKKKTQKQATKQVKHKKMKSSKKNTARIPTKPRSKYEGGSLALRMTRSWFQNLLSGIIHRRSKVPPMGLSVRVAPRSVMKRLCRGQFHCDASIDFRRVVFQNIRLTGGSLEAKHMTLGVVGVGPRYANQFTLHANNCTLTEDDLFESSCIRNGLAKLLVRILSNAGHKTTSIQVTAVNIVPSGKISVSGLADTGFGSKLSFEVRTFIGKASRGHIVTFPGLEVSLGPSLGVFVPVVPDIDLDIGHNAVLRDVVVDGRRRRVTLSASTTVTPNHTMKLAHKYRQHSESYAAQFFFDVGRFVTNLGNFTN